jgi:hypothetical protein
MLHFNNLVKKIFLKNLLHKVICIKRSLITARPLHAKFLAKAKIFIWKIDAKNFASEAFLGGIVRKMQKNPRS